MAAGCRSGGPLEVHEVVPELTMEGVRFRIDRGATTTAKGEADRVTYRRDTTAVASNALSLIMASAEGPVRVTAPTASGIVADRRFDAAGGIVAVRGADRAVTAKASYEPGPAGVRGAGRVHGSDPVTVSGPGYRLDGRGFTLDPTTGLIVLGGGARLVSGLPVTR